MRKTAIFLAAVAVSWFGSVTYAQPVYLPPARNQGVIAGGLGYASIDGQSFFVFNLRPEFNLGQIGLGLEIPLHYNVETQLLRDEDWDEGYDFLRTLRYVRFGRKNDAFFAVAGEVEWARLGHGFILNQYNNNVVNYEGRKIGLILDADAGVAGLETLSSNLGRAELFASRLFVRPMYGWGIPVIGDLAIGVSAATDLDPDGSRATHDRLTILGADLELPLLTTPLLRTLAYIDVASIVGFGGGSALGMQLQLRGIFSTLELTAQLERRYLGDRFIPAYFDAFYELDRQRRVGGVLFSKAQELATRTSGRGVYGMLQARVLNTLDIIGAYDRRDGVRNSGHLHLRAFIQDAVPNISARATYDRIGVSKAGDLLRLDDRSVARFGLGYRLNAFLVFYLDYIWTYRFDPSQQGYVVQRRVEPQISFAIPFRVGR